MSATIKKIIKKPLLSGKSFRLIDFNPYDDKFAIDETEVEMNGEYEDQIVTPPLKFIITIHVIYFTYFMGFNRTRSTPS